MIKAKYLFYEKPDFKKEYSQFLVQIENDGYIKRGIMEFDTKRKSFIADFNCNLTKGEELVLATETLYEIGKRYYKYLEKNGYEQEFEIEHFKFIDKSDLPVDVKYDSNYTEVFEELAIDLWDFVTGNFSELLYNDSRAAYIIKAIKKDAVDIKNEITVIQCENLLTDLSKIYSCKKDELTLYLSIIFNYIKKFGINAEAFDIKKGWDSDGRYTQVVFLNDERHFPKKEEIKKTKE